MIFHFLDFSRLSDLECPDFVGTTRLGCCIPPCFLVMFATGWERTFICWLGQGPWRVVEHVNGWCFRGIYKGGLWENNLHVSAHKQIWQTFTRVSSARPKFNLYIFFHFHQVVFIFEVTLLKTKIGNQILPN